MKRQTLKYYLIAGLLVFICSLVGYRFFQSRDTIQIAMVGPITGQSPANGRHHLQGIQLLLDEINDEGGIQGKKIELVVYDDENDPDLAREKAKQVADNKRIVAVIGHNYSSCSIAAGEIYKARQIPAITPSSTDVNVTLDNDWFFRIVYNNLYQGRLLADYIHSVLEEDSVSIIYEDLAYGTYLASILGENLKELGVNVEHQWEIKTGDNASEHEMATIVSRLKKLNDKGVLFLALHAPEGIRLVKLLRDAGIQNLIIGPNALASKEFAEGFNQFPKEKLNPGFYSNEMHVITPLVFDSAGERVKQFKDRYSVTYKEVPDWRAVFAYEAASLVTHAIRETGIQGRPDSIREDRLKIRNYLAQVTQTNPVEGITGLNFFDQNGDSQKPISIGVYKNKKIISALTQIQAVLYMEELPDLEKALAEEQVIPVRNGHMYKTNVVYTGVRFNEISDIDVKNRTAMLDFTLWFRYQGDVDAGDVEFLNSVEPIKLGDPFRTEVLNKIRYDAYRIEGLFKMNFSERIYAFDRHLIGVSFRNKHLTQKNLVYVVDILGMGMTEYGTIPPGLKEQQVLPQHHAFTIDQVLYSQDTIQKTSMGSPSSLNSWKQSVDYSQLNAGVIIKKKSITLRGLIPVHFINALTFACLGVLLLLSHGRSRLGKKWPNALWLFRLVLMSLLLLSSEVAIVNWFGETDQYLLNLLVITFDILWWLIAAYLINTAIQRFIMNPLERKTDREIPSLARKFVAFTVYFFAVAGIIAFVYDQKITSLLATSGLVAMIIGLAIQINISNIFSGIAINLETPFRINDWVKIGDYDEGKVMDITWRSTRIANRDGNILSIPNSMASESVILNYNYPNDNSSMYFMVHIDPIHNYKRVQKILLDAVKSAEGVLDDPPPSVSFSRFTDWSAEYAVAFYIAEYGKRLTYTRNVWKRIYTHLDLVGIRPLVKRQEIHMMNIGETGINFEESATPKLDKMMFFNGLPEKVKKDLSEKARAIRLATGEEFLRTEKIKQDKIYLVAEGVLEIVDTQTAAKKRAGADDLFSVSQSNSDSLQVTSLSQSTLLEFSKLDVEETSRHFPQLSSMLHLNGVS